MSFKSTMAAIGKFGLSVLPIFANLLAPGTGAIVGTVISDLSGGRVSSGTATQVAGKVSGVLEQVVAIIGTVEHLFTSAFTGQQTGPQKLLAALPDVKTLLMESQLLAGHEVVDAQGFTDGATLIINGVVKVLNSVAPKGSAVASTGAPSTETSGATVPIAAE